MLEMLYGKGHHYRGGGTHSQLEVSWALCQCHAARFDAPPLSPDLIPSRSLAQQHLAGDGSCQEAVQPCDLTGWGGLKEQDRATICHPAAHDTAARRCRGTGPTGSVLMAGLKYRKSSHHLAFVAMASSVQATSLV